MSAVSGPAGADGRSKEKVRGNPDCAELGYENGFKIDIENPPAGLYTTASQGVETEGNAEGFEVEISYSAPKVFDFDANTAVNAVIVKAQGAHVYSYEPPVTSDQGLIAPHQKDISHITFCWDGEVPPPSTTTTTAPVDEEEPGEEEPDEEAPPAPAIPGVPTVTG